MDEVFTSHLSVPQNEEWRKLLATTELHPDRTPEVTLLLYENEKLIATGSRDGNVLKYLAVAPSHQGEDLTATVLTRLRQNAFSEDHTHLFLYTKPKNKRVFTSLLFYPVAEVKDVLLLESKRDGLPAFLSSLTSAPLDGVVGSVVMNANPFTLGHRYLVEEASRSCDHLILFVLSEDKSEFSASDRLAMVRRGVADLPNVHVYPSGPYLISSATFPTYFLKEETDATRAQCELDSAIFAEHYAPAFGITRRFVGTEPFSEVTRQYNAVLKETLPARGIDVREIPRLEKDQFPISASRVRQFLANRDFPSLRSLVPESTYEYLIHRCTVKEDFHD